MKCSYYTLVNLTHLPSTRYGELRALQSRMTIPESITCCYCPVLSPLVNRTRTSSSRIPIQLGPLHHILCTPTLPAHPQRQKHSSDTAMQTNTNWRTLAMSTYSHSVRLFLQYSSHYPYQRSHPFVLYLHFTQKTRIFKFSKMLMISWRIRDQWIIHRYIKDF